MDSNIITYLACICFLIIFGRVFIVPIKKILKLVLNSVLGGVLIYIINLVGANWGFHIGLNFFTSILIRNIRCPRSNLLNCNKTSIRIKKSPGGDFLFYCNRLSQISRLINIKTFFFCNVIR
ncbi:MAG: pro-sigmaK processing inhibitor BofA family protein [Clostridia bacterium]|nr:pro-sigmaK processing inhibitor BofA family protein [Clostridia bacterium]